MTLAEPPPATFGSLQDVDSPCCDENDRHEG